MRHRHPSKQLRARDAAFSGGNEVMCTGVLGLRPALGQPVAVLELRGV
jgi:hypothetical protein